MWGSILVNDLINDAALLDLLKDERKVKLRRKQLLTHYFTHLTKDPAQMSDIGGQATAVCQAAFSSNEPPVLEEVTRQVGDGGQTIKTLFRLRDGNLIESVLMFYPSRTTLCISSQVGCAMKCPFCATGKLGLKRNLEAVEIIEQVWQAARLAEEGIARQAGDANQIAAAPRKASSPHGGEVGVAKRAALSNIVFMGMGEPTQNLDAIFEALEWICEPAAPQASSGRDAANSAQVGDAARAYTQDADAAIDYTYGAPQNHPTFGIPARNITISTVGSVPGIRKLRDFPRPSRLAISLHAPSDELRNVLVPMNKTFNVAAVLNAGFDYFETKKRRVSIEYALMRDMNDSADDARLLAKVINQRGTGWAHINLIPLNEVEGSKWTASTAEATAEFIRILESKGVPVTLRDSRGSDIDGACGQLAGANSPVDAGLVSANSEPSAGDDPASGEFSANSEAHAISESAQLTPPMRGDSEKMGSSN